MQRVLGIESSCDETGVALYDSERGLLGHEVHSQAEVHRKYGGVVPELASRDHLRRLLPLLKQLLERQGLARGDLDGVAYTAGPGLSGALLAGAAFARALAYGLEIPAVGVHHLEGHLLAPLLESPAPEFPYLALLVSGGHTQLVEVTRPGVYRLLGESLDDAVGEAFDKTARLLGLPYPGGAALARLAETGRPGRVRLPRPMTTRPGLDFSFSGLKTAALHAWRARAGTALERADLAREFVEAAVETLLIKCRLALRETGLRRLVAAGGVSANRQLRAGLAELAAELGVQVYCPRPEFCTDNGAMIALAGCLRLQAGCRQSLDFTVRARWPLPELESLGAPRAAAASEADGL